MRVFVAGANGALGVPLTRLLVARGHSVVGLIRTPAGAAGVRALGAQPLVADALDCDGLLHAVNGLTANAVIHELTSLRKPPLRPSGMALTNRLRTEGTANLLAAAVGNCSQSFSVSTSLMSPSSFDPYRVLKTRWRATFDAGDRHPYPDPRHDGGSLVGAGKALADIASGRDEKLSHPERVSGLDFVER